MNNCNCRTLGEGSFCTVKAVKSFSRDKKGDVYFNNVILHDVDDIEKPNCQLYAIKQLRKDLSLHCKIEALKDMENEGKILLAISHPGIVKLYGVGVESDSKHHALLMERICCCLEYQIRMWRVRSRSMVSNTQVLCGRPFFRSTRRNVQSNLWKYRLNLACQLADAMVYLHKQRLIFRDLKPSNAGIDYDDNLKLFDFGLATRLDEDKRVGRHVYKLTENTGTQKYMSPEVFRGKPYGTPADVYSFAIMLWEMLSLQCAFKGENRYTHASKVYGYRNVRPKLSPYWPQDVKQLIKDCWNVDAISRPSFHEIQQRLNQIN